MKYTLPFKILILLFITLQSFTTKAQENCLIEVVVTKNNSHWTDNLFLYIIDNDGKIVTSTGFPSSSDALTYTISHQATNPPYTVKFKDYNPYNDTKFAYTVKVNGSQVYTKNFTSTTYDKALIETPYIITGIPEDCNCNTNPAIECFDCPDGNDFVFKTQEDLNNFQEYYSHCQNISLKNLIIGNKITTHNSVTQNTMNNFYGNNITDLSALSEITSVTEGLYISGLISNNFNSLSPLKNIKSVGQDISIAYNTKINNLDALTNIRTMNGTLLVSGNKLLQNITGLNAKDVVNLTIAYNNGLSWCNSPAICTATGTKLFIGNSNSTNCSSSSSLTSTCNASCSVSHTNTSQTLIDNHSTTRAHCETITGDLNITTGISNLLPLKNVKSITGNLSINNNDELTTLNGLHRISTVGTVGENKSLTINNTNLQNIDSLQDLEISNSSVVITNNNNLNELKGLSKLKNISGNLVIENNDSLTNLNDLESIESVTNNISIKNNNALVNINKLDQINPNLITGDLGLVLENNPVLTVCDLPSFCDYLTDTNKPKNITNNAIGSCLDYFEFASRCGDCIINTTWNGISWSAGLPSPLKGIVIEGDLFLNEDLYGCKLTVNNGIFKLLAGNTLTISGDIINNASADAFILDNASLIQNNEAQNTGEITIIKNSEPLIRQEYNFWSSPVNGMKIYDFSTETLVSRIYTYGENGLVNSNPLADGTFNSSTIFELGRGYSYRTPNNWHSGAPDFIPLAPQPYIGRFTGEINNGNITVSTNGTNKFTSIGNPYPTEVSIEAFFNLNQQVNAIYFWKNKYPNGIDTSTREQGYSYLTRIGYVSLNNEAFPEKLKIGEGFLVYTSSQDPIIFTNDLRDNNHTAQRIINNTDRIILELHSENNLLNKILIGYNKDIENADAPLIDSSNSIYTTNAYKKPLAIKAINKEFNKDEIIELTYNINIEGTYSIKLTDVTGDLISDTVVYIKDKHNNTIHNLSESAFNFIATAEINSDRFELIFKKQDELNNLTKDWLISNINNNIRISTINIDLKHVEVYDLLGRKVYSDKATGSYHIINNIAEDQILIVKITDKNNNNFTKKISL